MSKRMKIAAISLLLVFVIALSLEAGYIIAIRTSSEPGLDVVEQAWDVILEEYVGKEELDTDMLAQGAIEGMLKALGDPYTTYLGAEAYQLNLSDFEGRFEGIGAYVAVRDEQIVIIAPIPDSPAERAGIRAGDIILEVDGSSVSGMSLAEVVLKVRGPEGTEVSLLVLHEGETEPEVIEIVRAEINVPSVYFEMKEDIAYIQVTDFSEHTAEELSAVLEDIDQSAAGIILDLRGNPGGLLEAVVDVASFFLEEGVVVDVVDNEGRHETYSVETGAITTYLPLMVLVDGYSASGSEVLAGALQDYGRAILAGTRTFGKGSVNILRQMKDGSALYITHARWLTPSGRLIEGEGLLPDYELELEGDALVQWAMDYLKG